MSAIEGEPHPRGYLVHYRDHVLGPIATAVNRVEREQDEIESERDAFRAFASRVDALPVVSASTAGGPSHVSLSDGSTGPTDELRAAYEETVMDVAHFEAVYGESIGEHLVAEFGSDFAALFAPSAGVALTADHQEALSEAAREKAENREQFGAGLEAERESLLSAYETLESLLADLDTNVVPEWYREQFDDRLADLVETRQRQLRRRTTPARRNGHELCEYLSTDRRFTYPVLTAVGRLLEATVIRE